MSPLPILFAAVIVTSLPAKHFTLLKGTEVFASAQADGASRLAGTWIREKSDSYTYQKITLVLRSDGTYTKTLVARVNGAPYGGTHSGNWTARGSMVHLSGDGNWPAVDHDLSEFQRAS